MSTVLPGHFAEEWLSVGQCAEFFGCSLGHDEETVETGAIPYHVFWHKRYVRRADLARFLETGSAPHVRRLRGVARETLRRSLGP